MVNVDDELQQSVQDGEQRRRTPSVFLSKCDDEQIIPQNTSLVLSKSVLEIRYQFPKNKTEWLKNLACFINVKIIKCILKRIVPFCTGTLLCQRIRHCFCPPARTTSSARRRWSPACTCRPTCSEGPTIGSILEETLLKVRISLKIT